MVRRAQKLMKAYCARVVSLVLLPALVLGTLPQTACICADGHREPFCRAMTGNGSRATADCGDPCRGCKDRGLKRKTCCVERHAAVPEDGIAAKTGSCCHPVVESAPPAAVMVNAGAHADLSLLGVAVPLPAMLPEVEPRVCFQWSRLATPPPIDVVIVFLHLMI